MKIIGIVSWYDESPAWLSATVASMAKAGMQHIVAVDGAYMLYPQAIRHPRSSPDQHAAIREVCEALSIGCTIHAPSEAFLGNETEKRSLCFRIAETLAEPFDDWYFIMDADQVITAPGHLHASLAETSLNVAEAYFYQRGASGEMNGVPALWPVRCIFRAIPGLEVRGRHFDYLLPDGTNLWGDPPYEPSQSTGVEVEHRTHLRTQHRLRAQNAYYARRDELRAEAEQGDRCQSAN